MSNLTPDMIGLDQGLNLQTAKILAPKGSVLDTLNYEQVDFQGQKRIDGFTRYDGSVLSALDEYLVITVVDATGYTPGSLLSTDKGLLGVLVSADGTTLYVAIINEKLIPVIGQSLYTSIEGELLNETEVASVVRGVHAGDTPEEHYQNLLAFNQFLRDRVETLPGPVAGLHWFRDRLHAIAGVTYVSLEGTDPQIFPTDVLTVDHEGATYAATVLDSFILSNTRVVFLDTLYPQPWLEAGNQVERNGTPVGEIANGYEEYPIDRQIASIFEARSEEQVLAEAPPYDFGWRFIALGWKVYFEDGVTLYGGLPSINQNIEGIGTQGPTPTSGANGSPRTLFQKVSITNARSQVNGWKSSQSPENYNLTVANLDIQDNQYIYADAYVTWNGTTGVVSAPGANSTSVLVEYPATNTVEVVF